MLAIVPEKRVDGGSSFQSLFDYMRYEVNKLTGEVIDRGEPWISESILSEKTAIKEMKLAAMVNSRCENPVYHYILSCPAYEKPSKKQWQECVKKTLKSLGFEGHQAVAIPHDDTNYFHVHIEVNRVHPDTGKAHYPEWSYRSLDECLRHLEKEHNWSEGRGLYRWDNGLNTAVKTEPELLEQWRIEQKEKGRTADGKASKMERYSDSESLQSYIRGKPAKAVRDLMKQETATWQALHTTLQKHGLTLHKSEKGGYTVSDKNGIHIRASKALRETFSGKENRGILESRLGEFELPQANHSPSLGIYDKQKRPKRDPQERESSRNMRAVQRLRLKNDYKDYKGAFVPPAVLLDKAEVSKRMKAVSERFKTEREKVKSSGLTSLEKRAFYSVLAVERLKEQERLRVELSEERRKIREANKPQSFKEWVADRADEGNEAAIAQLRGWAYTDKRKAKELALGEIKLEQGNSIVHALRADPVANKRLFEGINYQVDRNVGAVRYFLKNVEAFTDHGRIINLSDVGALDGDSVEAALRLARQKFGPVLTINGSEEFKQRVLQILTTARPPLDVTMADPSMEQQRLKILQSKQIQIPEKIIPVLAPATTSPPVQEAVSEEQEIAQSHNLVLEWVKQRGSACRNADREKGQYAGPVIYESPHHLVQDLGRGDVVIHQRKVVEATAGRCMTGDKLSIKYQGNAACRVERKTPGKGHER